MWWSCSASPMRSPRPKTCCCAARRKKSRREGRLFREPLTLHLAADDVGADAVFLVVLRRRVRRKRRIGGGLLHSAHSTGVAFAVVHLCVDRDGDFVRQVRGAQPVSYTHLTLPTS